MRVRHTLWPVVALAVLAAAAGSGPRAQQPIVLDQQCTVTVGNQTAFVRPDGSFQVRNISIFVTRVTGVAPQLYRARATCVRDGQMITGQSDFFELQPSQTAIVEEVFSTAQDPIPIRISVSSTADTVPFGETAQLTVIAHFADGSSEDRTPRAAGTTYLSTNTALLTGDEEGLVTGANTTFAPEMAMIAVLNEGNVAMVSLTASEPVANVLDPDGDGMPSEYELLFGLDPNDGSDGAEDLDADGLNNLTEFALGTLPNNPDTDSDFYIDGHEVAGQSDPLNPLSPSPGEAYDPGLSVSNEVAPNAVSGFSVSSGVSVSNQGALGGIGVSREVSVANDAAPDAIDGKTIGPSVSVENTAEPQQASPWEKDDEP